MRWDGIWYHSDVYAYLDLLVNTYVASSPYKNRFSVDALLSLEEVSLSPRLVCFLFSVLRFVQHASSSPSPWPLWS